MSQQKSYINSHSCKIKCANLALLQLSYPLPLLVLGSKTIALGCDNCFVIIILCVVAGSLSLATEILFIPSSVQYKLPPIQSTAKPSQLKISEIEKKHG